MILYDAQRTAVSLGERVGQGGEASVFRMSGQPDRLAKIYEPEPRAEYLGKLTWMAEHAPDNPTQKLGHASLAWPEGLLFDARRKLQGYWMPYIQQAAPLLDVFNPRRRAEVLPGFDRRYLIRTARNLSAALGALHRSGYVAGDLNESNVLVTPTALVTLIDTDSFQVREERDGKTVVYPCPVGKPDYTPPELQGRALAEVNRVPDHDAFGLAVLVFQLLMEGSHPFRAQWLGTGDPPPLEARIASGAYPYAKTLRAPILPPRNGLAIDTLHPWLVDLFQRCFVDGHRDPRWRPGPDLWVRALEEAERNLVCCAQGHYYASHLHECPYCAIAQKRAAAHSGAAQAVKTGRPPLRPMEPGRRPAPNPPPTTRAAVGQATPPPGVRTAPSAGSSPVSGGAAAAYTAANPFSGPRFSGWARAVPGSAASWPGAASASSFTATAVRNALSGQPMIAPGAVRNWVRQRTYDSFKIGGAQGALAGALPGGIFALIQWSNNASIAWPLLFSLSGAAAGLLRGWKPGHRLASLVDQGLGWKRFWQILGGLVGAGLGGIAGIFFVWAVIPVILGLVLGAQTGVYLGKRIWQVGQPLGWERIWGALSGIAFGGLGFGLARLIGWLGLNMFGDKISAGLLPLPVIQSWESALLWGIVGGIGGALIGALVGSVTDLLGRLTGLVN
jgi:hypothetical protein